MSRWLELIAQAAAIRSPNEVPSAKLLDYLRGYANEATPTMDVANTSKVDSRARLGVLPLSVVAKYVEFCCTSAI
jgi:hypothetical protein